MSQGPGRSSLLQAPEENPNHERSLHWGCQTSTRFTRSGRASALFSAKSKARVDRETNSVNYSQYNPKKRLTCTTQKVN